MGEIRLLVENIMSSKKSIRSAFRLAVFNRDKYLCRCCGKAGLDRQGDDQWKKYHPNIIEDKLVSLDAHHITNRDLMPNGGYVAANGISVCDECHIKAEKFWSSGIPEKGFAPDNLYLLIGSSKEKAVKDSEKITR